MFPIDSIRLRLQHKKRQEKLRLAQQWPPATAEINHWSIVTAHQEIASSATPYQIEASFHFTLNGEYFGGYLRSVALTHHGAEMGAKGEPTILPTPIGQPSSLRTTWGIFRSRSYLASCLQDRTSSSAS